MVFTPDLLREKIRIKNPIVRNFVAEIFGTFLLIYIGLAIVAQFILSHEKLNTWININVGWGFAIVMSVQSVAQLSGGHLNPAISLMMYTFGKLSLLNFGLYCVAQMIGAFLGAVATYIHYYDAINAMEGSPDLRTNKTMGVFSTYPAPYMSQMGALFDQAVGTGTLALFVAVIVDKRNKIPAIVHPLYFGFVVLMIGTAFGMNVGYPINPARDLAPRIFTYFIYGSQVFTHPYPTWFLVPIVGPMVGAVAGAWMYHLFAGAHIPDEKEYLPVALEDNEKHKNGTSSSD